MHALTAAELLAVWENGSALSSPHRALLILGAAAPETPPNALGRLSIGRRDDLLLQLRAAAFGPHLEATATCPHCGEKLEMAFNPDEFRPLAPTNVGGVPLPGDLSRDAGRVTDPGCAEASNGVPGEMGGLQLRPAAAGTNPGRIAVRNGDANNDTPPRSDVTTPFTLECDDHSVTFRLPDSFDLVEIATGSDLVQAEAALLRRCVLSARIGNQVLSPDQLPAPVVTALAARLAEADPQADLSLSLICPACDHHWLESFDIMNFFWREIEAWAVRLLREVHTLAAAYGWSETEIVALSPARRRRYLEMIAS